MAASGPPIAFTEAYEKIRQSVTPKDAQDFQSTTLKDVWAAAREIESVQRKRRSIQNMRRIEPFLKALEKYSKTIETICNGTPYLPYIWAPIKLLLQLASEFANVFEKLLIAYSQIAEALPRFERFEKAFSQNSDFLNVMGMVYAEILEFHRLSYKFFRRRAWHIIFDSLWKDSDSRFNGILESLARHRDLVDKEALSIDIVEARQWREQAQENLELRGNERRLTQLHHSMAWLAVEDVIQEDDLDRLSRRRQPGTCEWIFSNSSINSWFADTKDVPILWLKGIPGAGKSVLSSHIIQSLLKDKKSTVAYYFCNSHNSKLERCGSILRSVALQILRENQDLAAHVSDKYANYGGNPSMVQLRKLIPELLANVPATRIVIDGLDECHQKDQQAVLQELLPLCLPSDAHCKVLFSSREGAHISKMLRKNPYINLKDKNLEVDNDIRHFVNQNLAELRERFGCEVLDRIEQKLVEKADGMFLWVRLVIATLEDQYSLEDLEDAVTQLPNGLHEAYGRILDHIMKELSSASREKAVRVLEWIACSYRILKAHEILDGIVFKGSASLTDRTKLNRSILDLCKPLIEEGPGDTIDFVHFSAKEYILHIDSGPFLRKDIAHRNIAFSCAAYLTSSLCFIEPTISEYENRLRVVKGYHSLHRYAQEYWFEHLLEFARLRSTLTLSSDNDLIERVRALRRFEKEDLPPEFSVELSCRDVSSSDSNSILENEPEIQEFLDKVLVFRDIVNKEKQIQENPEDLMIYELRMDPTYFSEILQRYQDIVELLLDATSPNDLMEEEQKFVADFRETNRDTFSCRYRKCQRYVYGFASRKEREKHETLHLKTFKCIDYMCEFYSSGFRTKKALQKHNSKYHAKQEEAEIPVFGQAIPLRPKVLPAVGFIFDVTSLLRENRSNTIATIESLSKLSEGPHIIGPDQIKAIPCLHDSDRLKYKGIISSLLCITNAGPEHQDYEAARAALAHITEKLRLDSKKAYEDDAKTIPFVEVITPRKDWKVSLNPGVLRVLDLDEISKTDQTQVVTDMAFSPDGKYLAICGVSTNIHDVLTGELMRRLVLKNVHIQMPHDHASTSSTPSGESQPSLKKKMSLADYAARKDQSKIEEIDEPDPHSFLSSPSASFTERQPSLKRHTRLDGYVSQKDHIKAEYTSLVEESAKCVSFAPHGHILATGGRDGTLGLWSLRNGGNLQARPLEYRIHHLGEINGLEWARKKMSLACCAESNVYIWSYAAEELNLIRVFNCQKTLLRVALSADAKYVAAGDNSLDCSLVYLWDITSGHLISQFTSSEDTGEVKGLSFSPTKRYTLIGCWNRLIKIWDLNFHDGGHFDKSNETTLYNDQQPLSSISFAGSALTPDGRWLISTCQSGSIQFWNLQTDSGDVQLEVTDIWESVSAVTPMIVCSPVRGIFATFGDGVIRIWVYKHYCPGSTNIPVDSNLIDGCDFERRQPFDQILADMKRTLNTTLLTMAPLWRRHIINKLIENERIIFLAEKYWQLVLHLTKDEELTRSFINSYILLSQQFLGDHRVFVDPFTVSPGALKEALFKIHQCFLMISDKIEKHRVKIRLSNIDLSIANQLVGRDVTMIPTKESFDASPDEIVNFEDPPAPAERSMTLSLDEKSATAYSNESSQHKWINDYSPNQVPLPNKPLKALPRSEILEISSDEEATNPESASGPQYESIVISSDEDRMEVDFMGERPLKRKRPARRR